MEYILTIVAIFLITRYLGRYLTEIRRPLFPFKPFNCRPCFTFWLTILLGFPAFLWVSHNVIDAGITALILAFLQFFILKTTYNVID